MERIAFGGSLTRPQFSLVQRLLICQWRPMTIMLLSAVACAQILNWWMAALIFAATWSLMYVMRARQWRQLQASDQHQITGNISEQGLEWNTPMTSTRLPWQKIIKVRQHPDMLLLFYSANCALYLPKSFFASEQAWNEAKQAIILFSRGPS